MPRQALGSAGRRYVRLQELALIDIHTRGAAGAQTPARSIEFDLISHPQCLSDSSTKVS
jgi:hypothetical protein